MIFNIDRNTVTEGDVVELSWQCESAEKIVLTLDNGFRSSRIPLEPIGSKRFRLNRSKGRTRLTLTVTLQGKEYSKTLHVRVKKMPTTHAETIDSHGHKITRLKRWRQSLLPKWHSRQARHKQAFLALPERKQVALVLLSLVGIVLLVGALWPPFSRIGSLAIILYLVFILFKR